MTPDLKTMFINIQHPGESPSERSDPSNPKSISSWPDKDQFSRPRSATIAIWRKDGKVVGL
jgi:secreted PhoX family phosphatase